MVVESWLQRLLLAPVARMVEIANRIGQLETMIFSERTAGMDAERPVQSSAVQWQRLTRNPTTQAHAQLAGLIDTKVWRKLVKLDAFAKSAWDDSKLVVLSCIGQLDRKLMNAMTNSAASATPVMNVSLRVGPEQASSPTLHFLLIMTTTGKALDIVGNSGEGEALKAWRWLVLEFDQRAKEQLV